jgi:Mce-associated membrane protein
MTSRRPVNRVTSKRRPTTETARAASARPAVARKPRVAGVSRTTAEQDTLRAEQRSVAAPGSSWWRTIASRGKGSPRRRPAGRARWGVSAAMLIAAVLLGGFAWLAAQQPGVNTSNQAYVDNEATQEVRAAADNALRTVYAYDVKNIDGYRDTAKQVLTGKMLADLDKYADTTISAVKQAQTSADAKADPIAVTLLTDDRAELIVNLVVSATKDGVAQQSVAGPVVLHMQKVDGRWLASDIVDQ